MSEYKSILNELRRKRDALDMAIKVLEEEFGTPDLEMADVDEALATRPPERWAPGTGEPASNVVEKIRAGKKKAAEKKAQVAKPARPEPPRIAARGPAVVKRETSDTPLNQVAQVVREVIGMIGDSPVLPATVINYCASRGLPADAETVGDAIAYVRANP